MRPCRTGEAPEDIGAQKYDETTAAIIAQLKYCSRAPLTGERRKVPHNDSMGVRLLARETSDKRTGVFTSSTVAIESDRKVALCFTGSQHAGENMADVLNRRAGNLSPHPLKCAMRGHAVLGSLRTVWKS